jgi:outer membrane lipoprotein-sorting protein
MTVFARRPALRWLAPLVAVVLLTTAGSVVGTLMATARDSLPPRSAAQLLVDVQEARLDGLSGTIVQTSDLGLPELPGIAGGESSEFSSLVSGSHTMRLWYAGPEHARLALLGQFGESDLIRNGNDVWAWSSRNNTATHATVPADHPETGSDTGTPAPGEAMTPQQAADRALKAIGPSTAVSTDPTAVVAGRTAYQLVLEPRAAETLVGSVRIAIDGATHIPTRVQVFAKGSSTPAFEVGFSSFDPSTPSSSVFGFNPPPGAKVTEQHGLPGLGRDVRGDHATSGDSGQPPHVVGRGWTSVVVATVPKSPSSGQRSGQGSAQDLGPLGQVLKSLPVVSGSWGSGHLLEGTVFTALLTDDGRLAVGAVPPAVLEHALSAP